jgi:hypothetical protein
MPSAKPASIERSSSTFFTACMTVVWSRPTGLPMDCQHRARPEVLRDPLTAPNQSNPHLSPYQQFAGCTASVGAKKIESTERYLGIERRRRTRHRRTS